MICKTSVGKHKMLWWCLNFWPWDIKQAWLIRCGWYSRVCYAMLNGKAEIRWNRFVYCGVAGMYIILYCKHHQTLFPQFVLKEKTEIKSLLLAALERHIIAPMGYIYIYISMCIYEHNIVQCSHLVFSRDCQTFHASPKSGGCFWRLCLRRHGTCPGRWTCLWGLETDDPWVLKTYMCTLEVLYELLCSIEFCSIM